MNAKSMLAVTLSLLLLPAAVHAGTAGQVTHLSGTLSVKRGDGSTKLLAVRSEVQEGDLLTTEADTYARIKFVDGGEVVLRPGSQLRVANYSYNEAKPESDGVLMNLVKGGLRAVTGLVGKRNHDAVSVTTPTATIGIRGTHFGALLCSNDCVGVAGAAGASPQNGLHLDVADGAIIVRNPAGQQLIAAGQFGFVRDAGSAPLVVPPQQGVQVTMPPAISQNSPAGLGIGKGKEKECVAQ